MNIRGPVSKVSFNFTVASRLEIAKTLLVLNLSTSRCHENLKIKRWKSLTSPSFSLIILLASSTCSGEPRMMNIFSFGLGGGLLSSSQNAPDCWLICLIVSPPEKFNEGYLSMSSGKKILRKNTFPNDDSGFCRRHQKLVLDLVLAVTSHAHAAWSTSATSNASDSTGSIFTPTWRTASTGTPAIRCAIHSPSTAAAATRSRTSTSSHLAVSCLYRKINCQWQKNRSWEGDTSFTCF